MEQNTEGDPEDQNRPLLSPAGSGRSSPHPSVSSAQHLPDLDLAAQRPTEIRVTLPQQDGQAVDSAQRPSVVTPTQIIIGDQQPASARVVGRMSSGIQVHISTRDKGGQARRAAFRGHMVAPDPEGAARKWQRLRSLLLLWFALSAVSVILSMWWLEMGAVAGILGVAGASISVMQWPADLDLAVSGTRVLSITAMMMSALVAGVCAYIVSMLPCTGPNFTPYICSLFHVMLSFVVIWFALMSALAGLVAYMTTQVKKLLDPVTTGVMTLH